MSNHQEDFMANQALDLPIAATKESCANGTFIVTGANTGLGYEAAKHYVALGSTKVILAVRSIARGEEAKAKIEADTGIKGVAEVWQLDLSSYDSVKAFANKVQALERVDAIVENAAVALSDWTQTEGLESTLTVNVTGTLLLAGLVLPKLKESASKFGILPHLSFVGSGVAFRAPNILEALPSDADILDALNTKESFTLER
jgi:NAD(P)-dependent dehydrogenase (short-subunit alcohol dehydrogenase family)